MIKQTSGYVPPGSGSSGVNDDPGMESRLAGFAAVLSDPGSLQEPIGGPSRGVGARGVRGPSEGGPGGSNNIRRPSSKPRRSGKGGGGYVSGQGPVSPGGVYTPNPGV